MQDRYGYLNKKYMRSNKSKIKNKKISLKNAKEQAMTLKMIQELTFLCPTYTVHHLSTKIIISMMN